MAVNTLSPLRETLLDRRQKLGAAAAVRGAAPGLDRLIGEVDAALARMESGSYGLCDTCHDPIETDRHGHQRVIEQVRGARDPRPDVVLGRCLDDLHGFRAGASQRDDVTMLLLQRSA